VGEEGDSLAAPRAPRNSCPSRARPLPGTARHARRYVPSINLMCGGRRVAAAADRRTKGSSIALPRQRRIQRAAFMSFVKLGR